VTNALPKLIAFYLPQFHPFPENDEWWGKGFTEWVNVAQARPLWRGHSQPRIPLDMGFYDLRLPEVQIEQARLARRYGIHGFAYHYYWFSGKQLLHKPLEILLADRAIEIPFCLCYANQNWTRRWNGQDDDVLLRQTHDETDDRAFIRSLIPFFRADRYIRIDDKPLLLVYRTGLYPNPAKTAEIWREEAGKHDLGLFLCRVEFGADVFPPAQIGYDAAVEFPPHRAPGLPPPRTYAAKDLPGIVPGYTGSVVDYPDFADGMIRRPLPDYTLFRTAMPGWDNSPRRRLLGDVMINTSPAEFERWLAALVKQSMDRHLESERFVFINAWNEWGEGAYLEPCRRWGHGYLEAVRNALTHCGEIPVGYSTPRDPESQVSIRSTGAEPKISIIVSTDLDPPALDRCFRALARQSVPAETYEAVFVDSVHAHDWEPVFDEFMKTEGAGLNFRFHKIGKGGRAKANNFGMLHTSADIVVFLVDDFIPSHSFIEAHLRFHQRNRDNHWVGIGGGFFPQDIREDEFCRWLEDSGELFGVSFTTGTELFPNGFFYVANSSLKRDFVASAGAFDESFPFPAWDDYEMGLRLAAQGMKSVYLPDAQATHWHHVGLSDRRIQMKWAGISSAIFELRHSGEQPWHARCAIAPSAYQRKARKAALKFWLTGKAHYSQEYRRLMLNADFVRAYSRAKTGLKV
jgi:GT2 family glycosyltransferase